MAILKDLKFFQAGGLNYDDAIEYRPKNDYFPAYNIRPTGTGGLDEGYITNIDSNDLLSASVTPGISRCIGSAGFESARIGLEFYYNSASYNSIREINYDTDAVTIIPIPFWPLNPQYYVNDIKLINNTFLCFNDGYNPPAYVNYSRLKSGAITGYNQMLLVHRQPSVVASASYGTDTSRNINLLNNKLFQFRYQYIYLDYEQSVDSTISPLFIPAESTTPTATTNVSQNNNLTIQVDAGDSSTLQVVIDARTGGASQLWETILTINRADILNLPLTVDIPTQQYLAYNPVTNLLTFVFYNDGLYVNKPALETDQLYDNVPLVAGAMEVLNGNELIFGDITTGYNRSSVPASITATNYNPNLTIPSGTTNPLTVTVINPGQSGSGLGNNKRLVQLEYSGSVKQYDTTTIILVDIRNSSNTLTYTFTASLSDLGNTAGFISENAPTIPYSSTYTPTDGQIIGLSIITPSFFTLQSAYVTLYNGGSGVFKSIHALKSNSSYQVMLAMYDYWGRPFPLQDLGIVKTNSYAQSHGKTPVINWQLLAASAPANAYTYQFVLSKNTTHTSCLDGLVSVLNYNGTWNAHSNVTTPIVGAAGALTPNQSGTGYGIGTVYQISTPSLITDTSLNLGNGVQTYNSGDYVVNNGTYWFILPASYGNLASTTDYYFYFNSLNLFNTKNNSSVLTYDFTDGDRCTVYASFASGVTATGLWNWYDGVANPIIDVQVQSYDAANFLLRTNGLSGVPPSALAALDVLIEVYTPYKQPQLVTETVFYETGQVYNIVNGQFQTLNGTITQGDVYFKTRQLQGSVDPNNLYTLLVEDFNYTDYFPSAFTSYGRPRSYNDIVGQTEQIAVMNYSEQYVTGSQVNGLTRFYPENVYGDSGGQTSSNYGAIKVLNQVNNELLVVQENNHGSVPVYTNVIEDMVQTENVAISEKILNNIRYTQGKHIGIGRGRRSFAVYNNIAYWIDENRNEPVRWAGDGCLPIGGKMTKYFRQNLQIAYAAGLQPIGWYDIFNDEYVISIPQPGGVVQNFSFAPVNFQYLSQFSVLPSQITLASTPTHSSPSYNSLTGVVVITPSANYVGSDSFKISFPESPSTVNICYNWTTGSASVNPFYFQPVAGAPLSTSEQSNTISVLGNDFPVPISITGNTGLGYSINGGGFTSAAGTVKSGDLVQVQVNSSGSNGTLTSCVLNIAGQTAEFDVVTRLAGNYTVYGKYGMGISGVVNGTATGTPAGLASISVGNNQSLSIAYTTTGGGNIQVTCFGTPVMSGHVQVFLSVGGVTQDAQTVGSGTQVKTLTFGGTYSDPTAIQIGFQMI